jgi:hypothetical protein
MLIIAHANEHKNNQSKIKTKITFIVIQQLDFMYLKVETLLSECKLAGYVCSSISKSAFNIEMSMYNESKEIMMM